ncbi:FMN-linked oxidoreductase [Corynespora cassiicola Philippines]|uniref:FMN-linked oxidoreductase n=1 Tax=Corynespora cassiicola Philippines TaxID=1448308 RepID=A0A2T2NHU8_CORCC|nr:FMN-linked oxidoreductase [Corynespora cassiicola Philippines]
MSSVHGCGVRPKFADHKPAQDGYAYELQTYERGLHLERSNVTFQADEWEEMACKRLSEESKGYTTDKNREAFKKWSIVPKKLQCPIAIAPEGVQRIFNQEGEVTVARATEKKYKPYILSSASSTSMEDVAKAKGNGQRYREHDITISLFQPAKAAGYMMLFVTLDTYVLGWRLSDMDNGYKPFLHPDQIGVELGLSDPVFRRQFKEKHDIEEDVNFLLQHWNGPIVLKRVQTVGDARRAREVGVQGIVVSNHGGTAAWACSRTLWMRRGEEAGEDGGLAILYDSGVRCGADIAKALALGAQCVLIGRPYMYGLALGSESLMGELELTLHLAGIPSVEKSHLNRSVLVREDDLFDSVKGIAIH